MGWDGYFCTPEKNGTSSLEKIGFDLGDYQELKSKEIKIKLGHKKIKC